MDTITNDDRLIDARRACDIAGLKSTSMLYRLISEDNFPPAIHVGRSARWLESEIRQWVGRKVTEARSAA
jgi:predicted DNA-binding transcriptional regulator AlpA